MVSAMNVLFNLLVVNNWTQCEIGYEATTKSKWVRLYFLAFHIIGVILVNNLVIAFIINAFLQQLAISKERVGEEVVEGEAVIRDRRAIFNASVITGTKVRKKEEMIFVDKARELKRLIDVTSIFLCFDKDRLDRWLYCPLQARGLRH